LNEKCEQAQKRGDLLIAGKGLCKGFPGVWQHLILDHIDIDIMAGEIHTLLGENGAGKTVIANCLSGFYSLSEGQIYVKGQPVTLKSPRDGIRHGIGMVHQELALVKPFTVAQNIALGLPVSDLSFPLPEVENKVRELSEIYKLYIDPLAKVEDLSAGEQQRAEIIKVLYHDPEILILDEPTSLISAEADRLFEVLENMAKHGYGILFITHKIEEALEVGDRVTVLRLGKSMGTRETTQTDKAELVQLMFGEHTPVHLERKPVKSHTIVLDVKNLEALAANEEPALQGVSFSIREGEILGFAGISGNGQSELAEVITGMRRATKGQVIIHGKDYTNHAPWEIISAGVAHIPEKRRAMGVIEERYPGCAIFKRLLCKQIPYNQAHKRDRVQIRGPGFRSLEVPDTDTFWRKHSAIDIGSRDVADTGMSRGCLSLPGTRCQSHRSYLGTFHAAT
jgi:simple sugar transport system ATP-binding protein